MLQSIWDDVRREFSFGNMINKIIIVNVAVFLVLNLLWVFLQIFSGWSGGYNSLYTDISHLFAGSHDWFHILTRPWTLITHMFTHEGFFHLLWNMLYLFWFGRIFGDLLGDRRVLPLYILGGLAGFLTYFIAFNIGNFTGGTSYIIGASGAVFAILTAVGITAPEYGIRLFFLGTVRLKYIVGFAILMQVIGLGSLNNIGGTFDHFGGILMGMLYVFYLRRGTDLTEPVQRALNWIENTWNNLLKPSKDHKNQPPKTAYREQPVKESAPKSRPSFMRKVGGQARQPNEKGAENTAAGLSHQEELDAILDKIKERGYNSLTKDEKDFLFRASNQK